MTERENQEQTTQPETSRVAAPALFTREIDWYQEARIWNDTDDDNADGLAESVSLRATPEDFIVEEVPLYLPSGQGDHWYLLVKKRGMSTYEVLRRMQRAYTTWKIGEVDLGIAGQKDAFGVTQQWISIPKRVDEAHLRDIETHETNEYGDVKSVEIVEIKRHNNKLRLGHLVGNRFTVFLTPIKPDVTALMIAQTLEKRLPLVVDGFANYFGPQRFGFDGNRVGSTLVEASAFLSRFRPARSKKEQFLLSSTQSWLFNRWLRERRLENLWQKSLLGDVMIKRINGAPFVCTDSVLDDERLLRGDITVGGPLWGTQMRSASDTALTWESECASRAGADLTVWGSHPAFAVGDRRAACAWAQEITQEVVAADPTQQKSAAVRVSFILPKGSYATVFLRQWLGSALVDSAFGGVLG